MLYVHVYMLVKVVEHMLTYIQRNFQSLKYNKTRFDGTGSLLDDNLQSFIIPTVGQKKYLVSH